MAGAQLGGLDARALAIVELLLDGRVQIRIGQVDVGDELAQQRLCALEAALQGLDVLRRGIPPAV